MFTGLVEALGHIAETVQEGAGVRFKIHWPGLPAPLVLGESVAVNGCCLTVVAAQRDQFVVQLGPETLARTNLGTKQSGDCVNLERSLRVGDRLGGHFVQGHIDTTAQLINQRVEGDWEFLTFRLEPRWARFLVEKGSIAVDGVSLTVVNVTDHSFSVMLIPHTLAVTTLGKLEENAQVNIEVDILAKHVERLLATNERISKTDLS